MTQVEQIKAEIERRLHNIESCPFIEAEFGAEIRRDGKVKAFKDVLSFIDSLPAETASPEFEEFEKEYMKKNDGEIISVYDRHAGLLDGAEWQKQQMMKEAVEGKVISGKNGSQYIETIVGDWKDWLPEKVKLIILKDDD